MRILQIIEIILTIFVFAGHSFMIVSRILNHENLLTIIASIIIMIVSMMLMIVSVVLVSKFIAKRKAYDQLCENVYKESGGELDD